MVASFRESHISALKWLNEHTDDTFAFFAVQVKAVRIGDSPIAPVFEIVTRPNKRERRLQTIAQATRQMSSLGQFRQAFWTHYVKRFPDEQVHRQADTASSRWRVLADISFVVTVYLAQKEVGVFIRGLRGADRDEVFEQLAPHLERL